jgi:NADPH:quinone reductase-like Zn-dependent oxidoreductase
MRKSRQITAFSLNRMDVSQREGLYPVPQDAPEILGVEFAGHITALGPDTSATWTVGDQVLGLASGVSRRSPRTYVTMEAQPSLNQSILATWF